MPQCSECSRRQQKQPCQGLLETESLQYPRSPNLHRSREWAGTRDNDRLLPPGPKRYACQSLEGQERVALESTHLISGCPGLVPLSMLHPSPSDNPHRPQPCSLLSLPPSGNLPLTTLSGCPMLQCVVPGTTP